MPKTFVLKVGGSILSSSDEMLFNKENALKLKETLEPFIKQGNKFILCPGGGYLCRKYQKMAVELGADNARKDYVGIAAVNLNTEMLWSVFNEYADHFIPRYETFDKITELELKTAVLVSGVSKPGHSSDWDTVKLAIASKSFHIISLKNVDGVYTADPKKDPSAKRIDKLSWNEYLNVIGNPKEFVPGGNFPVDPIASRFAQENKISFYIIDGRDNTSLSNILNGGNFIGTTIY